MMAHASDHASLVASPWVARYAHLIRPHARVLDLAAGSGRNARFLAGRGARVLAVDRDAEALAACAGIRGIDTLAVDLETCAWPLAQERFDAIVVCHYLHRPLLPQLRAVLATDGVLLYETFSDGQQAFGRPSNPDFLLRAGELLQLAALGPPLTVVAFEQGLSERGIGVKAVMQRIAAVGPEFAWPPALSA